MKIIYLALVELEVPGGPTVHTLNLMKGFQKTDSQVRLLCPKPSKIVPEIKEFDCRFISFFGYSTFRLFFFNLFAMAKLLINIITFNPDVIYLRDRPGNVFAIVFAKLFRIPFFIEMNGVLLDDFAENKTEKNRGFYSFWRNKSFLWANGLLFNCSQLCEKYSVAYNIPKDKTTVVTMHIDCDLFKIMKKTECRKQLDIPIDSFVLGYVGGFSSRHDLKLLKEIIFLLEKINIKATLLIVGDTNDAERKENLLGGIKSDQVIITGWVSHSDIPLYINAMDIGTAFVKESEGNDPTSFLKVKEYLACGVPVILNSENKSASHEYPENAVIVMCNKNSQDIPIEDVVEVFKRFKNNKKAIDKDKLSRYIHEKFNLYEAANKSLDFFEKRLGFKKDRMK